MGTHAFIEVRTPVATPHLVPVINFKLRFTAAERIAISELRATDVGIEDFYSLLDDPRLENVDLTMAAVTDGVTYTTNALQVAGVLADGAARATELLAY